MKVISGDTILSVSLFSGTANVSYPVDNVLNEYPRKPFKATGSTATIRIAESGDGEAVAMFAANADSVTITSVVGTSVLVGDDESGEDIELGDDESGFTLTLCDTGEEPEELVYQYVKENENNGVIWMPISPSGYQRTLDFVCTVNAGHVEIGIIATGPVMTLREMERQTYQEGPVDYSIDLELQSGNFYRVDLGRSRQIPVSVYMWAGDGDDPGGDFTTYFNFYNDLVFPSGKAPKAWLLSESLDPARYALWGRFEVMPKLTNWSSGFGIMSTLIREIN